MVSKRVRNRAITIAVSGIIIAGIIFGLRRLRIGSTIKEGAFGLGSTAGDIISQPIAGLTNALTTGITDIALRAQELFGALGSAGADVQGAFTGNRNAIKDFFDEQAQDQTRPQGTPGDPASTGLTTIAFGETAEQTPNMPPATLRNILGQIETQPRRFVEQLNFDRRDLVSGNLFSQISNLFSNVKPDQKFTKVDPRGSVFNLSGLISGADRRIERSKERVTSESGTPFGGFASATQQEAALQVTLARNRRLFPQFFTDTTAPRTFTTQPTTRIERVSTTTKSGQFSQKLDIFGRPIRSF